MISMVSGNNEKSMVTNELDDDSIEYLNVHQKKYGIWGWIKRFGYIMRRQFMIYYRDWELVIVSIMAHIVFVAYVESLAILHGALPSNTLKPSIVALVYYGHSLV